MISVTSVRCSPRCGPSRPKAMLSPKKLCASKPQIPLCDLCAMLSPKRALSRPKAMLSPKKLCASKPQIPPL
jgi:hypothetical protein